MERPLEWVYSRVNSGKLSRAHLESILKAERSAVIVELQKTSEC